MWVGDSYARALWDTQESETRPTEETQGLGSGRHEVGFDPNIEDQRVNLGIIAGEHPRDESLEEQRHGLNAVVSRDKAGNTIEVEGDRGYFLVDEVMWMRTGSNLYESARLSGRFMHDSEYKVMYRWHPRTYPNDFGISSNGRVVVPESVISVRTTDTPSEEQTATVTGVGTPDGELNAYSLASGDYALEYDRESFTEAERTAPVRVYEHNDGPEEDWGRVYSKKQSVSDTVVISNGLIRLRFNDGGHYLSWYDGGSWVDGGTLNLSGVYPIIEFLSAEMVKVRFGNHVITLVRGGTMLRIKSSGTETLALETADGDYPADTPLTISDYYATASNTSISRDYALASASNDATFTSVDTTSLEIDSLDNTESYQLRVGMTHPQFDTQDTVDWSFIQHDLKREVVPR